MFFIIYLLVLGELPLPIRVIGSTLKRKPNLTGESIIEKLSDERTRLQLLDSPLQATYDVLTETIR